MLWVIFTEFTIIFMMKLIRRLCLW